MKNVGISFSQESATICEIIVAGISAGKFHLSDMISKSSNFT